MTGRAKTFIPCAKLLVANKLDQSLPVNRILDFAPLEMLASPQNPFVTGLEGYFILESNVDATPKKIINVWLCRNALRKTSDTDAGEPRSGGCRDRPIYRRNDKWTTERYAVLLVATIMNMLMVEVSTMTSCVSKHVQWHDRRLARQDPRRRISTEPNVYKNRDNAEKFIRDPKEGAGLRPVRHWSMGAVIGYVLIVFLTKVLITLTQILCKNPLVKNLKLLKKISEQFDSYCFVPKKQLQICCDLQFFSRNEGTFG